MDSLYRYAHNIFFFQDCQFILHRLVGLFWLLLPLYCLRHMNPSNDDIFIIDLIGFSAMVPMYVLKWFTIVVSAIINCSL